MSEPNGTAGGYGPQTIKLGCWFDYIPGRAISIIVEFLDFEPIVVPQRYNPKPHPFRFQKLKTGGKWFSKKTTVEDRVFFLRHSRHWRSVMSLDVARKVASLDKVKLQRAVDFKEAIFDCFLVSTPELQLLSQKSVRIRIERWLWAGLSHHNGIRNMTSMWKSMTSRWKSLAIKSIETAPRVVPGSLWFDHNGNPSLKKLKATCLGWLAEALRFGITSKDQMTRLMHLCSTRGTPAPQLSALNQELNVHAEIIAGERNFSITPERLDLVRKIAIRLGHYARDLSKDGKSVAHLSLSNSASIESSRRSGGRAVEVGREFALWANRVSHRDFSGETIFGKPYRLIAGRKVFSTMCRENISDVTGDLIESDNTFDIDIDFENYVYEDRIHGLDEYTGYQILQWSIEEGVRKGCLSGSPFYDPSNPLRVTKIYPSVRVSPIGEPGYKARVITVGEAWLNEFLSPMGHELISFLKLIPASATGVSRDAQGFEWAKRLAYSNLDNLEGMYLLTSDLSSASEYLEHIVSYTILKGFCDGVGLGHNIYMNKAIELLCSPRFLEGPGSGGYEFRGLATKRACLMGDPGTKAALMLTMLVAEEIAFLKQIGLEEGLPLETVLQFPNLRRPWRYYQVAGDDHVAIGPVSYLKGIKAELTALGAVVNEAKSFISPIAAFYCEEAILKIPSTRFAKPSVDASGKVSFTPMPKIPYSESVHVDGLKVRLLSPCQKITSVMDEKNPALGKALFFAQKLRWLPPSWKRVAGNLLLRFYERLGGFLNLTNLFTYLPKYFGGIGLPMHPLVTDAVLGKMIGNVPDIVRRAILLVTTDEISNFERNALWAFSSNTTFRGLNMRTAAEDQLRALFTYFVSDSITFESLRELGGYTEAAWSGLSRRDQESVAKKRGFIPLREAIQLFERPTYFKQVLASLSNIMEEDPAYIAYIANKKLVAEVLQECHYTFEEATSIFPDLIRAYKKSESTWFARQAVIETYAFELVPGASKASGKVKPSLTVLKSFNTRSWKMRTSDLVRDLLFYSPVQTYDAAAWEAFATNLVRNKATVYTWWKPDRNELFISEKRIKDSLCTLSVPLQRS